MKIGIASDHAGFELKEILKKELTSNGYEVEDFGTHSSQSMDYPDVAHPLATSVENGTTPVGIAICGSGNGISMTVNKHSGIRAALCWNEELAKLARNHNDANILSLPARFITPDEAVRILHSFLSASFDGGRHEARVNKIPCK